MKFLISLLTIFIIFFCSCKEEKKIPDTVQKVFNSANRTRSALAAGDMARIANALKLYYSEHNSFPDTLEDLVPDYVNSTQDLRDQWGNKIMLNDENTAIVSAGRDGEFETADDITRRVR